MNGSYIEDELVQYLEKIRMIKEKRIRDAI
jgi:hypothetical protein